MQWYLSVLKNYVGFSGRARRKEYWMFTLINAIVGAIINVIQLIFRSGASISVIAVKHGNLHFPSLVRISVVSPHYDRSGA